LLSSISIAEREEGPEGIADVIRCEGNAFGRQYGTAEPGEKASCGPAGEKRELQRETGFRHVRISQVFDI
jgi:hypothetical protein